MSAKILFFAGSACNDSVNKKLAKSAYEYAVSQGADATILDLKDYLLPLYDGDLEADGFPENARKLKKILLEHDGFFIASPEYNSSFSPLLKNMIDWCSRPESKDEPSLVCYTGKVAAICAASPGRLGGLRGLVPLRMLLENINVMVVPKQLAVSGAFQVFDEQGTLTDEAYQDMLFGVVDQLIATTKALNA